MEQNLPHCVREAWDSVEESQAPNLPPTLSSEDSGPWKLLLYPKLGHLTWNDRDFNQELYSGPCGLLRRECQRHRSRTQNTCRRGTEPPDPDPDPTSKTQEPQTPSREVLPPRSPANARPAAFLLCLSPGAQDGQLETSTSDGPFRSIELRCDHLTSESWLQRI
ncbi:hypothetical protein mRhiFer1_010059 [Rhinolophus ferrumequinum]|uniref:Uncharacterized protein n=1 Tax=Rhinolophus ferrumequinum TaxID=59479 RepID=A0A7J7Y5P9_RHIFE|nr:hypothetical protein mRhiFer1_010059 [Rhinolophus ferrumequinum]